MGDTQSDTQAESAWPVLKEDARVDAAWPVLEEHEIRYLDHVGKLLAPRSPEQIFFHEHEETDEVLLIKKGHVKVVAGRPPRIVAIRKPGDIIGEMAFLRGKPRSASIVAYDEVLALRIPGQQWLNFLYLFPRAMHAQLVAADGRLDEATSKFVGSDWAIERKLANVLLELLDLDLGEQVDGKQVLRFNQRDLASLAAASHDSIKKIMRRLRDAEIIYTGRQTIEIWNREALGEIASGSQTSII